MQVAGVVLQYLLTVRYMYTVCGRGGCGSVCGCGLCALVWIDGCYTFVCLVSE